MAFQIIGNRTYYYGKVRDGGRVRSVYLGKGEQALWMAEIDRQAREQARLERREEERREEALRGRLEAAGAPAVAYLSAVDRAVGRALEVAGYHRPSRRLRWLRKRGPGGIAMSEVTAGDRERAEEIARDLVIPPRGGPSDRAVPLTRVERYRVDSLVERLTARPGDVRGDIRNVAALVDDVGHTSGGIALGLNEELAELARRHPREFVEETGGDLAEQTREAIIGPMRLPASAREGIKARARMIRDELAGPSPTAVEWHLAEAASIAWLDWHRCVASREGLPESPPSIKVAQYHDQRVDRSHRRYIRTLKALAAARKVDTTAIQINIGDPAGPTPAALEEGVS